jgi:hypothetical protein
MSPGQHSALSMTLVLIIGATVGLPAAGEPNAPASLAQSQDWEDWRFWMVLASLVVMSCRQLAQDVRGFGAWLFPALHVTPEALTSVACPNVHAASLTIDGPTVTENSMSGPVHADVASSSSGSTPPPTMPIFVSRYGEKYHYNRGCSGLKVAIFAGIESKSLCKTCDAQRKR